MKKKRTLYLATWEWLNLENGIARCNEKYYFVKKRTITGSYECYQFTTKDLQVYRKFLKRFRTEPE